MPESKQDAPIHQEESGLTIDALGNPDHPEDYVYGHVYVGSAANSDFSADLVFQQGPIPANGVNGFTIEAVLSVLVHRLEYMDGRFPCDENKRAIQHMKDAREDLYARTAARKARGVEGKEVK